MSMRMRMGMNEPNYEALFAKTLDKKCLITIESNRNNGMWTIRQISSDMCTYNYKHLQMYAYSNDVNHSVGQHAEFVVLIL